MPLKIHSNLLPPSQFYIDYAVWQELSENLVGLASLYRAEPFYGKFQNFIGSLYGRQMNKLGWDIVPNESSRTGTLRSTVINMMGLAGNDAVIEEAYNRFCKFRSNPTENPIIGDLRSTIFSLALLKDEVGVFSALKEIYEGSSFPEEQRTCLSAMGRVKDPALHAEVYEYTLFSGKVCCINGCCLLQRWCYASALFLFRCLSHTVRYVTLYPHLWQVRLQDVSFSLNSLSGKTDHGGRACWHSLRDKFDKISAKFGSSPMWGSVVGLSCRGLRTTADALEAELFFKDSSHQVGSAARRLAQALENVRTRVTRLDRDREVVSEFFSSGS